MVRIFNRPRLVVVFGVFLVAVTSRWLVNDPDMSIFRFDSVSYLEIARHAPALPAVIDVSQGHPEMPDAIATKIPFHHAQRLAGPFLLGLLAHSLGVEETILFSIFSILLLLTASLLLCSALQGEGLAGREAVLLSALFFFNPFGFRFYFSVPTYLGDIIFHLGSSAVVWGVLRKNAWALLGGIFICALGRQTIMTALPGALLCFFGIGMLRARAMLLGAISAGVAAAVYFVTGKFATRMNPSNYNLDVIFGLWGWLTRSGLPGHSREGLGFLASILLFGGFLARGLLSILLPLAIFVRAGGYPGKPGASFQDLRLTGLFLFAAGVIAQPILGGPTLTGNTVIRLTALALPALIGALGILLRKRDLRLAPPGISATVGAGVILFLSSFHHRYTILNAIPAGEYLFVAFQVGAFLFVAVGLNWELANREA